MKKNNHRFWLVVGVILISLLGFHAYASGQLTIPFHMAIIDSPTITSIEVYSDAECTLKMPSLYYGEISRNSSHNFTFYVKNTGTTLVTIAPTMIGDTSWGLVSFSPSIYALDSNDVVPVNMTVAVNSQAILGDKNDLSIAISY